jgi:hypothetical protein
VHLFKHRYVSSLNDTTSQVGGPAVNFYSYKLIYSIFSNKLRSDYAPCYNNMIKGHQATLKRPAKKKDNVHPTHNYINYGKLVSMQ